MSIQFKRGTTLQHATYVGAVGELTFDTDKKVAVLHDGITPGGWPQLGSLEANARYGSSFLGIGATVAANALTVTLNPCKLDFRSATLITGVPNNRSVSALSLVVPSGATLGTVAATVARLVLLAIDNAGTVELAVVNLAGGNNLDETTLISTTAISVAADANNVIYSTTARTSVPFRVVGFIDITEATAGTWAAAPTTVQGIGGQALAALSSFGYGQLPQVVTRTSGGTYYNATGKQIWLDVQFNQNSGGNVTVVVAGVSYASPTLSAGAVVHMGYPVPPGAAYSITSTSTATYVATETR